MGKTVVISGAGRGLGHCLASMHLERGDTVHMLVRTMNGQSCALAETFAASAHLYQGDISATDRVQPALRAIAAAAGEIDLLYNVAAIFWQEDRAGLMETDIDRIHEMVDTNACGPLRVLRGLDDCITPETAIVNVSSESGSVENTLETGLYAYSMSKAALNLASKIYYREYGGKRRIIVVDPGWMRTDMGGPDAHIAPEESAEKLIELADKLHEGALEEGMHFYKYTGARLPW